MKKSRKIKKTNVNKKYKSKIRTGGMNPGNSYAKFSSRRERKAPPLFMSEEQLAQPPPSRSSATAPRTFSISRSSAAADTRTSSRTAVAAEAVAAEIQEMCRAEEEEARRMAWVPHRTMDPEILLARKVAWGSLTDEQKIIARKKKYNKSSWTQKLQVPHHTTPHHTTAQHSTPYHTTPHHTTPTHPTPLPVPTIRYLQKEPTTFRLNATRHTIEAEKWEYRILGKYDTTGFNHKPSRIILMVRLKEPYYTLLDGSEKYWIPFYISSGTFAGSVEGRSQPFYGIINSISQHYGWLYPEDYLTRTNITIPNHTEITLSQTDKLFDAVSIERKYNEKEKYLISRKLLTNSWLIKCEFINNPFIVFHQEHLLHLNKTKQDILTKRINDLHKRFFAIGMKKICTKEFDDISKFLATENIITDNIDYIEGNDLTEQEIAINKFIDSNNPFGITLTKEEYSKRIIPTSFQIETDRLVNDFLEVLSREPKEKNISNLGTSGVIYDVLKENQQHLTEQEICRLILHNL